MKYRQTLADLLDADQAADSGPVRSLGGVTPALPDLLARCARALHLDGVPAHRPVCAFFVPGRIEVLGKHTDYAGGRSLLAAMDRGICLVATPRQDDRVAMTDVMRREQIRFRLVPDLQPAEGWPNYALAVARRVARNFPGPLHGANVAFASNLPPAAGMSSSSALIIGLFLTFAGVNELTSTDPYRDNIQSWEDLADYMAAVESGLDYGTLSGDLGVGTHSGSEDHTAILCAHPGQLVQYAFAPVRFERAVPVPPGQTFVIGSSGVAAEKTGAARDCYNSAAEQMRLAATLWRTETGREDSTIGAVLEHGPVAVHRLREICRDAERCGMAAGALVARLDQFIEESHELIPAAVEALAQRDLARFGIVVERSHELAIRVLGNQVAETIHLAGSARALGAAAASAFGAGFGGSVWALVSEETAADFTEQWRAMYVARFPERASDSEFFITRAGPPAQHLA